MSNYQKYCNEFPIQEMKTTKGTFRYRYYENKEASETVVLLVGGIGVSDLIYNHFIKFSEHFSVITFDYGEDYGKNDQLVEAIHELLVQLHLKVWFVGQSLGGFIAQHIAISYPDVTEGLILSNTGCLSEELSEVAKQSLLDMINGTHKSKRLLKLIPFTLFKKLISKTVMKKYGGKFDEEGKKSLRSIADIMEEKLTKNYELHMLNLLMDLEHHLGTKREAFLYLDNAVLLILSDDDDTFHGEVKSALIQLMPSPTVVTDLVGGHLALMVNCDEYVEMIVKYIKERDSENSRRLRN